MSIEHEAIAETSPAELAGAEQIIFPTISQKQLAWRDIIQGIYKWPIWLTLAYQDITIRYRRSVLGPFWITLSMAITVYSMGYLYAHLFHTDLEHYYPMLTSGMLTWALLIGLVTEVTDGFTNAQGLITQIKLPFSLHIHRIASRNIIIFFHNVIVLVPILIIYHDFAKINWCTLLVIPGLFIIYVNAISYGLILAMIGSRYRDVSQIIKSLMQVIFFVTPVMWEASVLPENKRVFVDNNPFYAFLQLVREPLLGRTPTLHNLIVVSVMTILGMWIGFHMFARYRARIVYWL